MGVGFLEIDCITITNCVIVFLQKTVFPEGYGYGLLSAVWCYVYFVFDTFIADRQTTIVQSIQLKFSPINK
ncbi:hypothetical protein EB093_07955 [bacterium]|nr:hypothetical protein [bacterium]